ncbi:MAG: amidohydrolase family protein [Patescibacteria group bacterium]
MPPLKIVLIISAVLVVLIVIVIFKKIDQRQGENNLVEQANDSLSVDTHVHLQGRDLESAAAKLVDEMDKQQVDIAIIVTVPGRPQVEPSVIEARTQEAVALYPDRLKAMTGGAVLGRLMQSTSVEQVTEENLATFRETAQELLKEDSVVGFGEMLAMHLCMNESHSYQEIMPNHPFYFALADIAAEENVPIDIHMEAVLQDMTMPEGLLIRCSKNPSILKGTIEPFKELLAHNPETNIVWQHIGWDNVGVMTPNLMRELLSQYNNLYLSLRVTQATQGPNRIVDSQGNISKEWLQLFVDFPDHFMLGSDQFVGDLGEGVKNASPSFVSTWDIIKQLPSDLASKIAGENASRIYHLEK